MRNMREELIAAECRSIVRLRNSAAAVTMKFALCRSRNENQAQRTESQGYVNFVVLTAIASS